MSRILVTGAAGLVGRSLVAKLPEGEGEVIASDLRRGDLPPDIAFETLDVTGDDPERVIANHQPEVIVHLASIVTPPPGMGRDAAFAVDVTGTRNVLDAALRHGVRRIVVTSSGAAYGYHPDNPVPLRESDPRRGNPEFAYADHKRQVEEMLAAARFWGTGRRTRSPRFSANPVFWRSGARKAPSSSSGRRIWRASSAAPQRTGRRASTMSRATGR